MFDKLRAIFRKPTALEIAITDLEQAKRDYLAAMLHNGVAGLHQNGDVASWSELRTGGRFEAWLLAFDTAREAAMKGTP